MTSVKLVGAERRKRGRGQWGWLKTKGFKLSCLNKGAQCLRVGGMKKPIIKGYLRRERSQTENCGVQEQTGEKDEKNTPNLVFFCDHSKKR